MITRNDTTTDPAAARAVLFDFAAAVADTVDELATVLLGETR